MKGKAGLLIGAAAGYVLGARAGREQYDKIVAQTNRVWNDPKVQEKAGQAQDLAKGAAHKTADKAKEKTGSGQPSPTSTSGTSGSATSPATPATPATPAGAPATPPASAGTAPGSKPGNGGQSQ